jgi:CHAT domain-containing protein
MLLMGAQATEPAVRAANLSDVSVLLFSTHGLTATQATGVGQAGLVLTPPPPGEERDGDDGFLAASEVASLRLAADWVILSACNTAVGDGTEPAGLGSLARSFFFAGARSLLASHWPVSDAIAPILVPRMLALERRGVDRAEAFRRAMGEVRRNRSHDRAGQSWAHPFYWAAFVLIGDGRR